MIGGQGWVPGNQSPGLAENGPVSHIPVAKFMKMKELFT